MILTYVSFVIDSSHNKKAWFQIGRAKAEPVSVICKLQQSVVMARTSCHNIILSDLRS